jgi:predicted  nucleic acid-binding Zn-ribbon protein
MNMDVRVTIRENIITMGELRNFWKELEELERKVAAIDDQLKKAQTDITNVQLDVSKLSTGIDTLVAQVKDLQNQLANAGLTAAQQAALASVVSTADSLNTAADAAAAKLPSPPPAPPIVNPQAKKVG